MPSFSFPVSEITYDGSGTGAYTDIKIGTTVHIKTAGGVLKGKVRVRAAATNTTIPIGVISKGDIEIADNDIVEVYNCRELWARVPRIDNSGTQFKDWEIAFNASTAQPPVSNGGVNYIEQVDNITGLITVTLSSSNSYAIANGASISSRLWNVIDGTITVGTNTSTTITATFPAGYRYVELTVTDSNGNTHTTYILVVGIDPETYPAYPVRISRFGGSLQQGWEASFLLVGASDFSDIPDGVPVMLWADESYGGTEGSLNGQTGRQHIKFVGWTSSDLTRIEPFQSDYTINAQNAQAILGSLPAFTQTTERNAAPTSWFQVANLTLWRHFHYLAYWHSTLFDVCAVELPGYFADYPVVRLDADAGSLLDQFNFVFGAIRARFTVGMRNDVYARYNPHLMDSGERAALTTIVTLGDTDWTDALDIESLYRPTVGTLRGSGIMASATEVIALLSVAPGSTPGQGASQDSLDRQLNIDQSDLNERVGREYARRNLATQTLPITILNIGVVADPAWQELVKFTTTVNNKRGITYTSEPFVLAGVDVTFDHENAVSLETWQLEYMTDANVVAGITVQVPGADAPVGEEYIASDGTYQEQELPPYEFVLPAPYTPDEVVDGEFESSSYLVAWNDILARTSSGSLADPSWADIYDTEPVIDVIAYSSVRLAMLTDANLFDVTNATDVSPTFDDVDAITGFLLLRKVSGVTGAVIAYGQDLSTGAWSHIDDFTLNDQDYQAIGSTPVVSFIAPLLSGQWGNYSGGWAHGDGEAVAGQFTRATYILSPAIEPFAFTGYDLLYDLTDGGADVARLRVFNQAHAETTIVTNNNPPDGSNQTLTANSSIANVTRMYPTMATDVEASAPSLSGSILFRRLTIRGTGFNPYVDKSIVIYYTGYGSVPTVMEVGALCVDDRGMDVDDFNLGIIVAPAARTLYSCDGYAADNFAEITGATAGDSESGNHITCIRIPFRMLDNSRDNDDETALQVVYGIYREDNGTTLTAIILDNTDRTFIETDITPLISSTYYYILDANALEFYGGDSRRALAFCKPVGGGATVLLGTVDGGATWTIRNSSFDGTYVRFLAPTEGGDGLTAYVAGADGVGFTNNFGNTITSKNGSGGDSFDTVTGNTEAYGVIPLQ